jgi:hypothetical protein
VIILCLEFDANTKLLALDLHQLAALHPGAQQAAHPGKHLVPSLFELRGGEASDTPAKLGLQAAEVNGRCVVPRREVRSSHVHLGLYRARQTADDLNRLGLALVGRLLRSRWDGRQRWESSHRVVALRSSRYRVARH